MLTLYFMIFLGAKSLYEPFCHSFTHGVTHEVARSLRRVTVFLFGPYIKLRTTNFIRYWQILIVIGTILNFIVLPQMSSSYNIGFFWVISLTFFHILYSMSVSVSLFANIFAPMSISSLLFWDWFKSFSLLLFYFR